MSLRQSQVVVIDIENKLYIMYVQLLAQLNENLLRQGLDAVLVLNSAFLLCVFLVKVSGG